MNCNTCGKKLEGRQKRFCSTKCKSDLHNKLEVNEEEKKRRLERHKIWRDANKNRISENKANYYQNHKEKLKKIRREYSKKHPEINVKYRKTVKGRYGTYIYGAKKRNLEFKISIDEFSKFKKIPCVYCGDVFEEIGVDRVDNSKGYIKGNIVSCCEMCNRMKLNYEKDVFLEKCKKIALNNNCS